MSRARPIPPVLCMSRDELKEISGARAPGRVIEWLKRQNIRCVTGLDGWPRVPRSAMLAHIGAIRPENANHGPKLRLPEAP